VSDANTTAIKITANDVIIDLNGFSIIGPIVFNSSPAICPPAGTGNGIDVQDNTGVKIFNGTVRGMGATGVLIVSQSGFIEKSRRKVTHKVECWWAAEWWTVRLSGTAAPSEYSRSPSTTPLP
jgi:hypothetical protein